MFHCGTGAGYAIDSLLPVFYQMGIALAGSKNHVHISFTKLDRDENDELPIGPVNVVEYDPSGNDKSRHYLIEEYVRKHGIDTVFGFDQPVRQPAYKYLRRGGVKYIISYWGAPMSDLNRGIVLGIKKLEVRLAHGQPDHYIFESIAMSRTAYEGRGIPKDKVSVVYLGVDCERFKPARHETGYAHDAFNIPGNRKIIYYSGHMEERKGIAVLVKAAAHLYEHYGREDFHFLLLGQKLGYEQRYLSLIGKSEGREHITFGGYRKDVDRIAPSCYLGVIASTGWDSFTMSSLEMAASGLPIVVSDLQGLSETIEEGKTGFCFPAGDHAALSARLAVLLDDEGMRNAMSIESRNRMVTGFTKDQQVNHLIEAVTNVIKD